MLAADPRMSTHADGTSQTMRALLRLRELLLSGEFAPGARM
jgi:DNA-binding GntR family transcriptional regulator